MIPRKNGLLRCYDQNTINQNPFIKPGKQDITTHVDFTSVNEELNKINDIIISIAAARGG